MVSLGIDPDAFQRGYGTGRQMVLDRQIPGLIDAYSQDPSNLQALGNLAVASPQAANALGIGMQTQNTQKQQNQKRGMEYLQLLGQALQGTPEEQKPMVYQRIYDMAKGEGVDVTGLTGSYDQDSPVINGILQKQGFLAKADSPVEVAGRVAYQKAITNGLGEQAAQEASVNAMSAFSQSNIIDPNTGNLIQSRGFPIFGGGIGSVTPRSQSSAPASSSGTLAERNNNPLNIRYNPDNDWQGQVGSNKGFVVFNSPEEGIRAAGKVLQSYNRQGINTISGIVSRFAPPSENDTASYIANVARETGIDPNQPLDLEDPKVQATILNSMAKVESGKSLGDWLQPEPLQIPDKQGLTPLQEKQTFESGLRIEEDKAKVLTAEERARANLAVKKKEQISTDALTADQEAAFYDELLQPLQRGQFKQGFIPEWTNLVNERLTTAQAGSPEQEIYTSVLKNIEQAGSLEVRALLNKVGGQSFSDNDLKFTLKAAPNANEPASKILQKTAILQTGALLRQEKLIAADEWEQQYGNLAKKNKKGESFDQAFNKQANERYWKNPIYWASKGVSPKPFKKTKDVGEQARMRAIMEAAPVGTPIFFEDENGNVFKKIKGQ